MVLTNPERARELARNLVELLAPYEEELIALEHDAPAVGPLRRAAGMAIAEACYLISDEALGEGWTPDADQARRPGCP
jgi:hypothetical protein